MLRRHAQERVLVLSVARATRGVRGRRARHHVQAGGVAKVELEVDGRVGRRRAAVETFGVRRELHHPVRALRLPSGDEQLVVRVRLPEVRPVLQVDLAVERRVEPSPEPVAELRRVQRVAVEQVVGERMDVFRVDDVVIVHVVRQRRAAESWLTGHKLPTGTHSEPPTGARAGRMQYDGAVGGRRRVGTHRRPVCEFEGDDSQRHPDRRRIKLVSLHLELEELLAFCRRDVGGAGGGQVENRLIQPVDFCLVIVVVVVVVVVVVHFDGRRVAIQVVISRPPHRGEHLCIVGRFEWRFECVRSVRLRLLHELHLRAPQMRMNVRIHVKGDGLGLHGLELLPRG